MMLLLVAGAAALVAPGSRPSGAVACRGAAYDYCVQSLGCTAEEATKAEGVLLPNIAESMTRAQAEERLQLAAVLARPERRRAEEGGDAFPSTTGLQRRGQHGAEARLAADRLNLDDAQLKKMVLKLPQLLGLQRSRTTWRRSSTGYRRASIWTTAQLKKVGGTVLSLNVDNC